MFTPLFRRSISFLMLFLKKIMLVQLRRTRSFNEKLIWSAPKPQKRYNFECIIRSTADKFKTVLTGSDISTETWAKIKENLITEFHINPTVIDTYILSICRHQKLVDAGKSYYSKLLGNDKKPSVVTTSEYLRMLGEKENPLTETEKEIIWKIYIEFAKNYSSFDCHLANSCVTALCKADYVEESIKVLNKFKNLNPKEFLNVAVNELIVKFFNNGNFELGFEYLTSCCSQSTGPLANAYIAYLNYCVQDSRTFSANVEKLFMLLKKYGVIPPKSIMEDYITACNEHGWSAKVSMLDQSKCSRCKHKAVTSELTAEEFQILKENFIQNLLIEKLYEISNPHEMKCFVKFIDSTKPYDVIIDGLNILYRNNSHKFSTERLTLLVNHYRSMNKKPLVIGRLHIAKYPDITKLQETTNFYFLKNMSKDDQFMLYAAIACGQDTIFVSNDYMRQHKYALSDPKAKILFKKWQYSHQYTYNVDINKNVSTHLLSGSTNDPNHKINSGLDKNGDFWHVPFLENWSAVRGFVIDPKNWVCFRIPDSHSIVKE